jgi:hypothetical protein
MQFSQLGLGSQYFQIFENAFSRDAGQYPHGDRGSTLIVVADFSGQSAGHKFETYSFLFFDPEINQDYFARQRRFRSSGLIGRRRMSFKALNDKVRRQALIRFLTMANHIRGCIVTFAISKNSESLFRSGGAVPAEDLLLSWKPKVKEQALRISHLSAYFAAAFSLPNQNLVLLTDEDAIASNAAQLKQLTDVFCRILSHYLPHNLRHVRCGTSRSDDDGLALEDLLAVSDLVAGATSEICTGFSNQGYFPSKGLVLPLPRHLSSKSLLISSWISETDSPMRRELFVLELEAGQAGSRMSNIRISPIVQ